MKRRTFIAALGGAAAWPVVARGQQPATPVIGYISVGYPDRFPALAVALRKGLSELGFVEGQNVVVERRFAEGHFERLPELAAELAKLHVNVIVNSTGAASVVQAAAPAIPIVSTFGSDPVRSGL